MLQNSELHQNHFDTYNDQDLAKVLEGYSTLEIVDILSNQQPEERIRIFNSLTPKHAVSVFEYLPINLQIEIIFSLQPKQISRVLDNLSPDDRTAFLEYLPPEVVNQLIKFLSPVEKSVTLKLLGYPEGSVGRLMTPDYIAVKMDWTIEKVLQYIREHGRDSETINVIYVVDDNGILIDDLHIRELLLARRDSIIEDLADHKFIALSVQDDEEKAVQVFRKYNRVALPVIDNKGLLLGIVTIDDILQIADAVDTEDMQKIGGMEALDEPYMQTSFFTLIQKRVGWLTILFIGETLTASAMAYYQDEISKAVVLALFIPLIISSGGNSGSQASTLIIRAMALGEIKLKDWWRIMKREILAGLVLGSVLGLIGFFRVALWSSFSTIYGPHWLLVAFTIFFSLIGVVMWGTFTGSMLPLILRKLNFDPATSSAPFIATLVDVTGLIIYFNIAMLILKGIML
ncbi:MAG: magnesium transporter [Parachlamydiaceae bacterium]|nr:magnesium transporter [Parachlamydiaceae bacterium]